MKVGFFFSKQTFHPLEVYKSKNMMIKVSPISDSRLYPLRLLMPALMTSSTNRMLLAITVQELIICFFTM